VARDVSILAAIPVTHVRPNDSHVGLEFLHWTIQQGNFAQGAHRSSVPRRYRRVEHMRTDDNSCVDVKFILSSEKPPRWTTSSLYSCEYIHGPMRTMPYSRMQHALLAQLITVQFQFSAFNGTAVVDGAGDDIMLGMQVLWCSLHGSGCAS
jgi:hypothetical protein